MSSQTPLEGTSFSVPIASSVELLIKIIVPSNAVMGSFNNLEIKIELTPFIYTLNTTKLVLQETPEVITLTL